MAKQRKFKIKGSDDVLIATTFRKQGRHVLLVVGYIEKDGKREMVSRMPSELVEIKGA